MNYQVLDVKVKDTEETAKLYTYFLDNSREIAPERVRPVIVICPGGGYEWVSEREAEPIALKFVGAGYHAVVLHYSVAPAAHYPTALRQLAWTVAHLREHAAEYHIDPNKVVVAGFSAGGHLAASYGVFWKRKHFLQKSLSRRRAASSERSAVILPGYHIRSESAPRILHQAAGRPVR